MSGIIELSRRKVLPLETFDHKAGHRIWAPFDPTAFAFSLAKNLAGHPVTVSSAEFRDWGRHPERLTLLQKSAVRDLFTVVRGIDLIKLRQGGGLSMYEIARLFRVCSVDHWIAVNWINQYSSTWQEDRAVAYRDVGW